MPLVRQLKLLSGMEASQAELDEIAKQLNDQLGEAVAANDGDCKVQ